MRLTQLMDSVKLGADREHRIQARQRALRHVADLAAADAAPGGLRRAHQLPAAAPDAAGDGDGAMTPERAEESPAQHGLAGAGLADQADRLIPSHRQGWLHR